MEDFGGAEAVRCSACGRHYSLTVHDLEALGGTYGRTCTRCVSSGFRFSDDTENNTNLSKF